MTYHLLVLSYTSGRDVHESDAFRNSIETCHPFCLRRRNDESNSKSVKNTRIYKILHEKNDYSFSDRNKKKKFSDDAPLLHILLNIREKRE